MRIPGERCKNIFRNRIDRCSQPIENGGGLEVARVSRMLFRLLAPPFGLLLEDVPKLRSLDHS